MSRTFSTRWFTLAPTDARVDVLVDDGMVDGCVVMAAPRSLTGPNTLGPP
jgi:hypothetical protein